MIKRYYQNLGKYIKKGKVLVIYGPRRSGKTTLIKNYLSNVNLKYKFDVGDNIKIQNIIGSQDLDKILEYAEGYNLIVIDEAQYIPNVGMGLKLLIDHREDLKVIVTGSSSFDLNKQVGEPLTGRHNVLNLFPVSQKELKFNLNNFDLKGRLEKYLLYGLYPEVLTSKTKEDKEDYLDRITNSYLLKDILAVDGIKASKKMFDLLRLIAFQVGNEVAHNELGQKLGMSTKTVSKYLDLLEKMFVLINVRGFSRNLRKEITQKSKYYFYDNGIRNSIIANFNSLENRNDVGALWENFLIIERIKKQNYEKIHSNNYFWRTYDQKEIDWIEEREGKIYSYEIKWGNKKAKPPKDFLEAYDNVEFKIINQDNYINFIT